MPELQLAIVSALGSHQSRDGNDCTRSRETLKVGAELDAVPPHHVKRDASRCIIHGYCVEEVCIFW